MWFQKHLNINKGVDDRAAIILPTLEDANSIQVGLCEVIRLLIHNLLDHRTAGLLLRALRTATINLKYTSLEPAHPTQVVIDPQCVAARPLGATAWSAVEGREYDQVNADTDAAKAGVSETPDVSKPRLFDAPPSPEQPGQSSPEQAKEKLWDDPDLTARWSAVFFPDLRSDAPRRAATGLGATASASA